MFCKACGKKVLDSTEICPKCGTRVKEVTTKTYPKSKGVAIALAILVGIFAWCYTWKKDAWKFWVGLISAILLCWTIIVPLGIFVWVVIDVCVKPKEWYENY